MDQTSISFDAEKLKTIRSWEPLPDFRFITALQGAQQLGPALQRAWRCMEDGEVRWEVVPTHVISLSEYFEAVGRN